MKQFSRAGQSERKNDHQKKKRFDADFHKFVNQLTNKTSFNGMIMGVILINALVIGLETVDTLKGPYARVFQILDEFFLSVYTVEFLLKVYAEPKGYWKSSYNRFDFLILFISYIQVILDMMNVGDNVLRPLRLLRAARTLRTISFIEGLQVLVTALIETLRHSVLNVVALLSMCMGFFAVVGPMMQWQPRYTVVASDAKQLLDEAEHIKNYPDRSQCYLPKPKVEADNIDRGLDNSLYHAYYMFGYDDEAGVKSKHFSDLNTAMLTLFTYVTVDGWTDIQKDIETRPYSQWYTISFIFLGHFIFTNLFIGIIIMNIHEATETFRLQQIMEKESVLQLKKDFLFQRQHNDVKTMLEKQKSSQFADFKDMCRAFQDTLRHDDHVIMTDTSTNLVWMETFITTLDHLDLYTYRCQQLHFQLANCLADIWEKEANDLA